MNFKRILSSALVVIMMFSAVALLIPVKSQAAHYTVVTDQDYKDSDQIKAIVEKYRKATFASAEEMFQHDKKNGYLDYVTNAAYSIYVNRYTGVMYYRDELTGKMLTSNSYNFNNADAKSSSSWASQISVTYSKVTDTVFEETLHSSEWAAQRGQIKVSQIENGLRVDYAVGTTATRCLLPVWIEAHEFENDILRPIFASLYEKMKENLGEKYALNYFEGTRKRFENYEFKELKTVYYKEKSVYKDRYLHTTSLKTFWLDFEEMLYAYEDTKGKMTLTSPEVKELLNIATEIQILLDSYRTYNPTHPEFEPGANTPQKVLDGYSLYVVQKPTYDQMADKAKTVKKYCPDYTFEKMYEDEEFCDYEHKFESNPIFRCALEYTFNEDNSLSVRLPSNSIIFDETEYILKSITPLKYFGAAKFSNDGYIFIPDGSGSIVEFEDFRQSNVTMSSGVSFYGTDYCYSKITGAHQQPLTMPVYGIVSDTYTPVATDYNPNPTDYKPDFGYFAILEEGASMATINTLYETTLYRDGTVYTSFTPYPADVFDLSDTISVGENSFYTKVSESKYSGSYVTRYVMLLEDKANYMGMAEYYRNYLEENGTLTALTGLDSDLPLYLEALGSLEVVEKILTFPINVSKSITTFDDVITMYNELGRAQARMLEKAAEYDSLAAAEKNLDVAKSYRQTADEYRRLADEVVNIDNVNFKLTGFANGGLYSTYPTKVRWERVLGGKRGFKNLLEVAAQNTDSDSTFGVYPDFDFQYISNTSLFDGVGKRNTVSRMVDNRYASKQAYSNITGEYDTIYSMIVSADALDRLYSKFIKKYSKYDATGISVSTLGSDLNSNFDADNPVSRDDAQGYVTSLLDRIANESNYSVMLSQGNLYSVKYADHILNVCTDASYYKYSSYAIPFVGMILHGYVNYAGAPLNYSGSPDYDLLRSLESGASLYYIVGYRNTDIMKDDEEFNKYYSVSYDNWFDDIVEKYSILNRELGGLQEYKITGHEVLIGERVVDETEREANLNALMKEFVEQFDSALHAKIDDKLAEIRDPNGDGDYSDNDSSKRVHVQYTDDHIDILVAIAYDMFELGAGEQLPESFRNDLKKVFDKYKAEHSVDGNTDGIVYVDVIEDANTEGNWLTLFDYESKYQYVTGSTARDDNAYDRTDYTVANDQIVMVTYEHNDGRKTSFILNYNLYSVEVTLEEGDVTYVIPKYGFVRIDHT